MRLPEDPGNCILYTGPQLLWIQQVHSGIQEKAEALPQRAFICEVLSVVMILRLDFFNLLGVL